MAPPTVRINTFVQNKSIFVDTISKLYILIGLLIGLNRVPVLTDKYILIIPTLCSSSLGIISVLYHTLLTNNFSLMEIVGLLNVTMYMFCILYNCIFYKKMRRFYNELNKFDVAAGCRPKTYRLSIRCFVLWCCVIAYTSFMFLTVFGGIDLHRFMTHVPGHLVVTTELHFYGHIVSLLLPRLRLINSHMQLALTTSKKSKTDIANEYIKFKNYNESSNCAMKNIMDLYYTIFKAHNYLIAAIKWQLLMIIVTSFVTVLTLCYHFSINIIRGKDVWNNVVSDMGVVFTLMVPLFAPCVSGDHIHDEVRRFRELLASRLYENKQDKSCRSIGRALLDFTENRDLSFRLIRILDVDISLPFKFVGLLVTYLIILMQFEQIINVS